MDANETKPKHASIFEAVTAAMDEVGYVKKQRTMGLNYSYAGEAALISALRPVMVYHGVFMYVLKLDDVFQSDFETTKGSKMTRTTLKATIRFQHEGGSFIDVQSAGEGMDSGDKSLNKAMTGAYKYALRQTFCIETGDDPDKHPSEPRQTQQPEKPPVRVDIQPEKPVMLDDLTQTTPVPPTNGTPTSGNGHEMTIDEAEAVLNSKGKPYGTIPSDKFSFMITALKDSDDPEAQRKLKAISIIQSARVSGRKVQA
jgi:hypothetical protein